MQRGRSFHSLKSALQCSKAEAAGLFSVSFHPRLVELDDIRAGGKQILHLFIHRRRIVQRHFFFVLVVIVLRLLRHGEWARQGNLDLAIGVRAQKLQIADLDGMFALNFADDSRHGSGVARSADNLTRIFKVHARERRREPVRVAFATHFAVRDDVEPRKFLRANREDRGVILRLLEELRRYAPQLGSANARRHPVAELLPINQPFRLRIRSDE